MAVIERWYEQDLKKPVTVQAIGGNVFSLDNNGALIGVKVYDDGEAAELTGSVTAYCTLADGQTVSVAGTREENRVYILMPQSALAVPGTIKIVIKLTDSSVITTLAALIGTVYRSRSDTVITPSSQIITDWAAQLAAELQNCVDARTNLAGIIAAAFAEGTANAAGTYVTKDGNLYLLPNGHEANTTWANTTKTQVTAGGEIYNLKSALMSQYGLKNLNGAPPWKYNYYLTTSGSTVDFSDEHSASTMMYLVCECKAGDMFIVNGTGGSNGRLWAFADASKNIISKSNASVTGSNLLITAPASAKYLIVNATKSIDFSTSNVSKYVERSENTDVAFDYAFPVEFKDGYYISKNTGSEESLASYSCTKYISCEYIDVYAKTYVSDDLSGIAFYDVNKTYISSSGYNPYSDNGNLVKLVKPSGACYVRITCTKSRKSDFELYYSDVPDALNQLDMAFIKPKDGIVSIGIIDNSTDLDDLENNTFCNINAGGFTVATNHVPVDGFSGVIITLCGVKNQSTIRCQIAVSGGNNQSCYWRQYYSAWGSWNKVATTSMITPMVQCKGLITTTDDLDDLLPGTIYNINSGSLTVQDNNVPYDGFCGAVITICGVIGQSTIKSQLAISGTASRKLYYRTYYTSWGSWEQIPMMSDLLRIANHLSILHCFTNITCCGDSLTYSQVYTGNSTSRQAYVTYPNALEKITGVSTIGIATAGYTAINWWNSYANNIEQKSNQLAIIYLGTNGGFTDTLSTDAPVNTDPSTWDGTTNTGCLAKIIAKWQSVGAKVCLVKCYATSGTGDSDLTNTNKVISEAAARFGCGLAENEKLADYAYHYWPNLEGYNGTHYNDLGYSAFAEQLSNNIATMDKTYLKYLIPN